MTQAKQILQQSSIYAIGNILRGLASFIMLPVYTTYLTPKDYGTIELISVVLDLTLLLLGARVAVGIFKFYSDADTQREKNEVISTAIALMTGVHLAAVLVIIAFNRPIAAVLNATPDFGRALVVYSLSAVFAAANEVFFSYLKILDRAITYVLVNLLKLIVQLALNILLIVYLEMTYWGVIWSAVISSALLMLVFSIWFLPRVGMRISKVCAKQLVQFSGPIILASIAMYYITFSSRYYLQFLRDLDAVGIYALANKFGMMIFSLVAIPFSEYWSARQFDAAKTPGSSNLFGQVFFYLNLVMLLAASALIACIEDIIHLSAAETYWSALPLVPWITAAFVLQAWGDYFRFGCFYTNNNRFITYSSFATVVVVTALYIWLIPEQGALGAGKAMFVASLTRFAIIYYYGQRLFRIDVQWPRILGCVVYFATAAALIRRIPVPGFAGIFVKGSVAALAGAIAFVTPLIDISHRRAVYQLIFSRLGRARSA